GLVAHPIAGKWSACEIVHHLADSESISGIRLRRLLSESYPVIHGYDQEAYASTLRYNARDITPALQLFHAVRQATTPLLRELREGADLVDLGAESTRPGATPVPADEQIRRLRPVLEALRGSRAEISVDTASGTVAQWAVENGACAINDTSALSDPAMTKTVAE